MRRLILKGLLAIGVISTLAIGLTVAASAAVTYEPLTVASGYNTDIVATSRDETSDEYFTNTGSMDNPSDLIGQSSDSCLYTKAANADVGYLPSTRVIASTATPGLTWKMASYTLNNALKLHTDNKKGTLAFSDTGVYDNIYFLSTASGVGAAGSETLNVVINYTEGEPSESTFTIYEWNDSTGAATDVYRRINSSGTFGSTTGSPYFTQCAMEVDSTRLVESVELENTSSNMTVCVFGVTGATAEMDIPVLNDATDVTQTGFTMSWEAVPGAANYRIDVATDGSFNSASILDNYNNLAVNGTTKSITGLNARTSYYFRVRSESAQGEQSASAPNGVLRTPMAVYNLNVVVNNSAYGKVTGGEGEYTEGDFFCLEAEPAENCYFLGYYDTNTGELLREKTTYEASIYEDMYITARFATTITATFTLDADSGYYSENYADANREGVIALNATFAEFDAYGYDFTAYGLYIYNTANTEGTAKATITAPGTISQLSNASGRFFGKVTEIDSEKFDSNVTVVPYAVIGGSVLMGEALTVSVNSANETLKWLGAKIAE